MVKVVEIVMIPVVQVVHRVSVMLVVLMETFLVL